MAEELGKIEKPEAKKFENKRKLYLVPLLYSWEDAPAEYVEKFSLYWQQAEEHIASLESKIGEVKRIYHESITIAGEEGLKVLQKLSPASCKITEEKCQSGAQVEAVEDAELAEENMDWERHLLMGFISRKVAQVISDFFTESMKKRYEHIAKIIDETLKEDEAALLFIREGHRVQFPSDIEVFSVAPPALDDIHRWLRERSAADEKSDREAEKQTEEKAEEKSKPEAEKQTEEKAETTEDKTDKKSDKKDKSS